MDHFCVLRIGMFGAMLWIHLKLNKMTLDGMAKVQAVGECFEQQKAILANFA